MKKKQKECFTSHVMMHSLFGLGLGLILAAIFPELPLLLIGAVICVLALVLDYMRK